MSAVQFCAELYASGDNDVAVETNVYLAWRLPSTFDDELSDVQGRFTALDTGQSVSIIDVI